MKQDQHPHGFSSPQPGAAVGCAPQRLDGVTSQRAAAGRRASWGFLRRGGHSWQLPEAAASCPWASPSLAAHPPRRGARSSAPPPPHPTPRGYACCPQPSSCKLTATALLPVTGGSSPALAPRAEREGGQHGLTPGSKVINSEMGPHPRSLASPPPIGQPGGTSMHKEDVVHSDARTVLFIQAARKGRGSILPPS